MNDEDQLDVAADAWLSDNFTAVKRLGFETPAELMQLAECLLRRGATEEARNVYQNARRQNPRIVLRGYVRALADRSRERVREEVADLMQWNARWLRVSFSRSPSLVLRKLDSSYNNLWRVWWTEEDAMAEAKRVAWRVAMEDAIEEAQWLHARVDRKAVAATAEQNIAHLQAGAGVGELLGQPGPLRITVSGFAFVQCL